jgi:serine/threonine-protein kinase
MAERPTREREARDDLAASRGEGSLGVNAPVPGHALHESGQTVKLALASPRAHDSTKSLQDSGTPPASISTVVPASLPITATEGAFRVGKYLVFAKLGAGGMAEVFLAVARGSLDVNKLVVVKRLLRRDAAEGADMTVAAEEDERERVRMFVDEGRLSVRLNHPNVVQTHEVVEHDGEYFLAMEYLEGQPLSRVARAARKHGGFAAGAWLRIVADALRGLQYAHDLCDYDGTPLGLVHRDVSPQNIFLTYDGAVKLVDFGIAKTTSSEATQVGLFKGKIPYAAPEQYLFGLIDPRADVYAMGIVLFELLTAKRPLTGGPEEMIRQTVSSIPIPPVSSFVPDVDPALDAIVARATEKNPDDRYQSAGEMRDAIEAYLRTRPEPLTPDEIGAKVVELFRETRDLVRGKTQRAIDLARLEGERASSLSAVKLPPALAAVTGPMPLSPPLPESATEQGGETHAFALGRSSRRFPVRAAALGAMGAAVLLGAVGFGRQLRALSSSFAASASTTGAGTGESKGNGMSAFFAGAPGAGGRATAAGCPPGSVAVRGGRFVMGSHDPDATDAEKPEHPVVVSPFCMDAFEVTAGAYQECVTRGQCQPGGRTNDWDGITTGEHATYDRECTLQDLATRSTHPINCVDWSMAAGYCAAEGGRLPTEAEWEVAARGVEGRRYPWGDAEPSVGLLNGCGKECSAWAAAQKLDLAAMYEGDDGFATTSPVGTYPRGASSDGVYDLAGNVREWTADWLGRYGSGEQVNPAGPGRGDTRVVRGAAWNTSYAAWARPTFRQGEKPEKRTYAIGFRCVRPLQGAD